MKQTGSIAYMSAALAVLFLVSLFLGRYPGPGFTSPGLLFSDTLTRQLILNFRLPRLITAVLLGAALGVSGHALQHLLINPLVEPGFLGVSQGSAFGASIAILFFGGKLYLVQFSALIFAAAGLLVSFFIAHRIRFGGWILRLVLAGISVSALFTAGLGFFKYIADPLRELPEITFWLLGGLWGINWTRLLSVLPLCIPALILLFLFRWRINAFSLSEEVMHSLGMTPKRGRVVILGCAVAATASMISLCGIVAWVGLIVPHLSRRLFNVDTRYSLPASMVIGALFILGCDDISRVALASEIPLGILTSLFGAGVFIIMMIRKRTQSG